MIRICIPNAKESRNRRVLTAYIFNCLAQGQVISQKKDFSVKFCFVYLNATSCVRRPLKPVFVYRTAEEIQAIVR